MTNKGERGEILGTLDRVLREIIAESWADEVEISETTSFNDDLELESIELVALAEKLQDYYGASVDFVGWLSAKELDDIIALTVGDLVEYILACRSSSPTA